MALIELNMISKVYGEKVVLDEYSLQIERGEFVALTGESGKGKSTILNIIGLLEWFDKGSLIIDGEKNINPYTKKGVMTLRNKISYLFQNFALIDEETVIYNLNIALRYVKCSKEEKSNKIKDVLKVVGLEGYENVEYMNLSGGEQQRVAIARIILKPCEIILADEPTGSLDEKNRDLVLDLLEQLNKQGKTIVVVTHDMNVAKRCNRIVNL